jgi:hypothetical protein
MSKIIKFPAKHEENLDQWLNKRAVYSNDLFDSDYSDHFMSYFNLNLNKTNILYKENDPDWKSSCDKSIFDTENSEELYDKVDDKIVPFIPGSNHCNANFIYKKISEVLSDIDNVIPVLYKNKSKKVKYAEKDMDQMISKKALYEFLMKKSYKPKSCSKY